MTSNNTSNNEITSTETTKHITESEQSHLCDQHITYQESRVTLQFDVSENWEQTLHGTCDVCGRTLEIEVMFDVEMMRVIDSDSNTVLHEY